MSNSLEQKQEQEDLMLIIQALPLLADKVRLNKSITELEGNKNGDNLSLIICFNRTLLRIELLKISIAEKITANI